MKNEENKKIKIDLNKKNIEKIHSLIDKYSNKGVKKVLLNIKKPEDKSLIVPLSELISSISYIRYSFLEEVLIKVSGLPYCLFSEPESFIVNKTKGIFLKNKSCRSCKFFSNCPGLPDFYYKKEVRRLIPQKLPEEIALEISSISGFSFDFFEIKNIIRESKKMGASIFRIILLDNLPSKYDIRELLKYAKKKKLQVRLDISRIKIKDIKSFLKNIGFLVDYLIVYLNYEEINEKKKKELIFLKKTKVKTIRAVTPATFLNIKNLWKIYYFIKECKIDKWAVNRDVGKRKINKNEIKSLVNELFKIKQDIKKNSYLLRAHIVYPIPFCFMKNPLKVSFVCTGAKSVDGYERLLIDKNGKIKPIHYFNKIIGEFHDIPNAWNSPFLKNLRSDKYLPNNCKKCPFREKCKGGSRFCAYNFYQSYNAPDPLMNFSNVKNYI